MSTKTLQRADSFEAPPYIDHVMDHKIVNAVTRLDEMRYFVGHHADKSRAHKKTALNWAGAVVVSMGISAGVMPLFSAIGATSGAPGAMGRLLGQVLTISYAGVGLGFAKGLGNESSKVKAAHKASELAAAEVKGAERTLQTIGIPPDIIKTPQYLPIYVTARPQFRR